MKIKNIEKCSEKVITRAIGILEETESLFRKPKVWTRGALARSEEEYGEVRVKSKEAVRFCTMGGIDRVSLREDRRAHNLAYLAVALFMRRRMIQQDWWGYGEKSKSKPMTYLLATQIISDYNDELADNVKNIRSALGAGRRYLKRYIEDRLLRERFAGGTKPVDYDLSKIASNIKRSARKLQLGVSVSG